MHRFLLICPIYEPYAGGGGQYFPYLRNSILMQCGFYSIDVITEYHSSKPTIERDPKGVIYRVLPKRDSKENKTYIYSVLSFILTYAILSFFLINICKVISIKGTLSIYSSPRNNRGFRPLGVVSI